MLTEGLTYSNKQRILYNKINKKWFSVSNMYFLPGITRCSLARTIRARLVACGHHFHDDDAVLSLWGFWSTDGRHAEAARPTVRPRFASSLACVYHSRIVPLVQTLLHTIQSNRRCSVFACTTSTTLALILSYLRKSCNPNNTEWSGYIGHMFTHHHSCYKKNKWSDTTVTTYNVYRWEEGRLRLGIECLITVKQG